jgi:DNA-binding transcriptional ArsR family regulator
MRPQGPLARYEGMPLNHERLQQRHLMWVGLFRAMESVGNDYLPGEPFYQAFTKIIIVHSMFYSALNGRTTSVSEISRRSGVPRQTVVRKLAELTKKGIVEQRGRRYIPVLSFFNQAGATRRFEKRRALLKQALGIT